MERILNKPGEFDYDFKNDIILFKVSEREYSHSIELSNLIIDFDEEAFVVGLQIINASETFQITKHQLRQIKQFKLQCHVIDGLIQINLSFNIVVRNQTVEYKPIIFERIDQEIPNSKVICQIA